MDSSLWQYSLICYCERCLSWSPFLTAWKIFCFVQVILGR